MKLVSQYNSPRFGSPSEFHISLTERDNRSSLNAEVIHMWVFEQAHAPISRIVVKVGRYGYAIIGSESPF